MKTRLKKGKCSGEIVATTLYTRAGLMRVAGLGPTWLTEARAKGLKSFRNGRARWYRGSDVIEFIANQQSHSGVEQ